VAPFYVRPSEIKQAQRAGDAAKQELMATCEDERFLAELEDVTNQHTTATGRRFEMMQA
jgi:hypothetical protein